jgi:hypothetical protein
MQNRATAQPVFEKPENPSKLCIVHALKKNTTSGGRFYFCKNYTHLIGWEQGENGQASPNTSPRQLARLFSILLWSVRGVTDAPPLRACVISF